MFLGYQASEFHLPFLFIACVNDILLFRSSVLRIGVLMTFKANVASWACFYMVMTNYSAKKTRMNKRNDCHWQHGHVNAIYR